MDIEDCCFLIKYQRVTVQRFCVNNCCVVLVRFLKNDIVKLILIHQSFVSLARACKVSDVQRAMFNHHYSIINLWVFSFQEQMVGMICTLSCQD